MSFEKLSTVVKNQEECIKEYKSEHPQQVREVKNDKYTDDQINGKLRQIYHFHHDTSMLTDNRYIFNSQKYELFMGFYLSLKIN